MKPNRSLAEDWYEAAERFVALDAAASMLEEGRTAFKSQRVLALGDIPVSRAEAIVTGSDEWSSYVKKMVRAREQANLAKVEAEFLKMKFSEHMSKDANARTEARMVR